MKWLRGVRPVPLVVTELSHWWCQSCHPKTKRGKRKEKTKHEMAPSAEGALDDYQKGFQESAKGDPSITQLSPAQSLDPRSLSDVSRKFWSERRTDALKAL